MARLMVMTGLADSCGAWACATTAGQRWSFRVARSRTGQTISLSVVLTTNVGDREIERPGQFPADPVQGIKPRAAAAVLTTRWSLNIG